MALSLADAIERGLRQNLGLLISDDAQLSAHGQLWEARSPLLPNISAKVWRERVESKPRGGRLFQNYELIP